MCVCGEDGVNDATGSLDRMLAHRSCGWLLAEELAVSSAQRRVHYGVDKETAQSDSLEGGGAFKRKPKSYENLCLLQ